MEWSVIGGVLLPLVGVLLGSGSTLISQYLATRVDSRREMYRLEQERRSERKEAIVNFLRAAQSVEMLIDSVRRGRRPDPEEADRLLHDVWLTKKVTELFCSSAFGQAAHDYALILDNYVWDESIDKWSANKRILRFAFLDAARRELGNVDTALLRQRGDTRMRPDISHEDRSTE